MLDSKTVIFLVFFNDSQKAMVFQRRVLGAVGILSKTMVFAPWRSLGAPWEACRRAFGSQGAPGTMVSFFFGARGVPLERPRYVPLQIKFMKPSLF